VVAASKDAKDLWDQTEAVVGPLLEQTGTIGYGMAEALIIGDEAAIAGSVQSLASATGVEPEEMKAQVQQAFKQYEDVARRAVGMSTDEWVSFSSFCDQYPRERAEASRMVFHQGDLSGIRDLVAQYKAAGPTAGWNDALVYRAVLAAGGQAYRESNGTTMVTLNGQTMPWKTAVAKGLLELA